MVEKRGYRRCVFVVIYRISNNRVFYLLLKRRWHWNGWEFTKGGVEINEKYLDAVKREIKEEAGQKATKIRRFNFFGEYRFSKNLKDRPGYVGQTYSLYSAEVKDKKVIFDKKEHSEFKWLEFDDAYKKLKWSNQKRCLNKVNEYLVKKIKEVKK